ncbi:MAG: CopG family transcriptional regulator [Psychroserpens sp.]|nr:CopG family transcriptional regulator [Psychroserpens sp.]
MSKQPISARIEKNILKDSKEVAKKENRSLNNLLETALIAYCKGKL